MPLRTVSPAEARRLIADGATLVDVREPDEHARERIPGARHLPLSQLDDADLAVHQGKPVERHARRLMTLQRREGGIVQRRQNGLQPGDAFGVMRPGVVVQAGRMGVQTCRHGYLGA